MKKTVLTFGLISGLIISVLMGGSLLLADKIGSGHSMALGYTIMVASFLLIYFGIRSYRDNTLPGQISFGRAFACGILITVMDPKIWTRKRPFVRWWAALRIEEERQCRSEEHTSELQSPCNLVCRLLLEK